MPTGHFVISLDLELYWGMRDTRTLEAYGTNILGVRDALPRMLRAFDAHDVKATFATVGLLFFDDKEAMLRGLPGERPGYVNKALSPYTDHFQRVGTNEAEDRFNFGASLVRMIQEHPTHEIACHTFSHYYCLERGQTEGEFAADLNAAKRAAASFGVELKSFVFPRNQYNERYLGICRAQGIITYRGNERSWLYQARNREQETTMRRGLRLLDTWLNLSGHNCHTLSAPPPGQPLDIPASRFLRPWNRRWNALEGLRLRRITKAMEHAARTGQVFHLWWHPHNFGRDVEKNIAFLERILGHYQHLNKQHGFESMTMRTLAEKMMDHDR
ncbi:MAG: polysaccharide deacetylase family protein [Flavobacteriales bacterium]